MGRRKNSNKDKETINLRKSSGRNSDVSDFESIAHSSVVGDLDHLTEDEDDVNSNVTINSFSEQIDNAQDKKIATRLQATKNIVCFLKRNFNTDIVEKWKLTLCEIIEKGLKRTTEEGLRACELASLLSLQFGTEIEENFLTILNSLRSICADESAEENLRSACAKTIGLCVYFSCELFSMQSAALQTLQSVWMTMKLSTPLSNLFTAAINSWVLILEKCNSVLISSSISTCQPKICYFFESPDVDVRISAGETLAVLFEIAVVHIENTFQFPNHEHLKQLLGDLAFDSSKYRTKRDKKVQQLTFRQVKDSIFENVMPRVEIKFNKCEVLKIRSYHTKLFYDELCDLLHDDLNLHLRQNLILRDFFNLGVVVNQLDDVKTREEKNERKNFFEASTKARNMYRSKQRDKKGF